MGALIASTFSKSFPDWQYLKKKSSTVLSACTIDDEINEGLIKPMLRENIVFICQLTKFILAEKGLNLVNRNKLGTKQEYDVEWGVTYYKIIDPRSFI